MSHQVLILGTGNLLTSPEHVDIRGSPQTYPHVVSANLIHCYLATTYDDYYIYHHKYITNPDPKNHEHFYITAL